MTETHLMYWELFPTVDHIVPVARGGADNEGNWVTTSMLRNGAKSNWTLEELGWQLVPSGELKEWDGLLGWFVEFLKQDSPAGFVNKVWTVGRSSTVAPDTLYVFLEEGTLIVASSHGKPSLGTWKYESGALTMVLSLFQPADPDFP